MRILRKFCLCLLLLGYLGICKGHLALFENGNPVEIFPYAAQDYSPKDQAKLRQGIPYKTPSEKQRILEDFLS